MKRFTVCYRGQLFDGDCEGLNRHDYNNIDDAMSLYNYYGDMIEIYDNEQNLAFISGEWF